jgi:5'-methylthioadenosine phosphorylase
VKARTKVGIFGGSGFYEFLRSKPLTIRTPYGKPSAPVRMSAIEGKRVAFLPRHGVRHEYPPHVVPYRANLYAFSKLGVERVIGPCAVGSLKSDIRPGDLVLCDQFANFTTGRKDTFYDGPKTTHISSADPYCPELRKIATEAAEKDGLSLHTKGTVVVIQGPRFSTRSESRFFRQQGWDVINMTQYPEVVLAREKAMCYVNLSVVTDYDVGLEGDPNTKAVSHEEVIHVFNENIVKLKDLVVRMVKALPDKRSCDCGDSLKFARLTV